MPKRKSLDPLGNKISYVDNGLMTTTTETDIVSEVIEKKILSSFRPYYFDLVFELSTGIITLVPTVTIKIKIGTASVTVLQQVALASLTGRRFKVVGSLVLNSTNGTSLFLDAEVRQDAASIFSGFTSSKPTLADITGVDSTTSQTFKVTLQITSILSGNSILLKKAILGM